MPIFFNCMILQFCNRQLTAYGSIETDDCLRARQTKRLELVVNDIHQVVVVASIHFDEHIVRSCSNMTLDNLRNLIQFFKYFVET